MSHYLFEISSGEENNVEFNVVDTFYGGRKHTKLTRNALFLQSELGSKPEDATLLACTCNEETKSVQVNIFFFFHSYASPLLLE